MKRIYVNLKRFDIPPALGGVNRLAPPAEWAEAIIQKCTEGLKKIDVKDTSFTFFLPEAHLPRAVAAARGGPLAVGCQGVYWADTAAGGNFGAFTSHRPAAAAAALGCTAAIIGHCEERAGLAALLAEGGAQDMAAADRLLGRAAAMAAARELSVLFCIGETAEQRPQWRQVLAAQLEAGLAGLPREGLAIAYEPVWAIGPGKTPPAAAEIAEAARFIKQQTGGLPLVYGGGLKADNAAMLASIEEIDGGLIALTRFSGEIGFYPEEFCEIVDLYLQNAK